MAKGSFSGSPALQNLDGKVETAYRTRTSPPLKAVEVHVTARLEKVEFATTDTVLSRSGYTLELLDAETGKLVDIPSEVVQPP